MTKSKKKNTSITMSVILNFIAKLNSISGFSINFMYFLISSSGPLAAHNMFTMDSQDISERRDLLDPQAI